jgi:hypothetical protein
MQTLAAWAPFLVLFAIFVAWQVHARRKSGALPGLPSAILGPADSISIGRDKRHNAGNRQLAVLLDGAVVGEIGVGEIKHFRTPPGPHTIEVRVERSKSRPLRVEKRVNQNLPLRCGAGHDGLRALFAAFTRTKVDVYVRSDG